MPFLHKPFDEMPAGLASVLAASPALMMELSEPALWGVTK
jgi:hypothetical protein